MSNRKGHVLAIAVAGVIGWGGANMASAQQQSTRDSTAAELKAQIEALQKQVQRLEAAQADSARLAAQSETTKAEVMRDAEQRSVLAPTAGYIDNKFLIRSEDGNFSLSPGGQLQFRYYANSRDDDAVGDDLEDGFEVRRAKFSFAGNVINKDTTYNFQWETDEDDGNVTLEEVWVRFKLSEKWHLRLGQIKDDVFHEETTSSKRQLAVDRSLLNELLGGGETDYVQGVRLEWDAADALRLNAMLHDGYNSDNTPFSEDGGTGFVGVEPTDWGVSGRVEYFARGGDAKKQYEDFSAMKNKSDLLVFGAGADYSYAGDSHALFHSIDVQWENQQGLGVYGAFIGLERELDAGAPLSDSTYDCGFLVQAAYMFNAKWEGFARWDVMFLDDDVLTPGQEDTINEFTIGVNYYLNGHNAKFTLDATYLPDGSPNEEAGIGVLETDEESFIFRGQFQLLL